jgi:HEAT repeat protein
LDERDSISISLDSRPEPHHTAAMRKRVHIAVAVLVVAFAGVVAWRTLTLRPHDTEPVYQGKGLRAWLHEYRPGRAAVALRAEKAIRQIGTNGIPTLLDMLRKKDSPLASKLIRFWHLHIERVSYLPNWVRGPAWSRNSAETVNCEGAYGFAILGADAQQAVPALIDICERSISPCSESAARGALVSIGPAARQAIPLFLPDVVSPNWSLRLCAVSALRTFQVEPSVLMPVFAKSLKDADPFVRRNAAEGLGNLGAEARQTVPALAHLLSDPEGVVRSAATNALKAIDPEAAAKAGVK